MYKETDESHEVMSDIRSRGRNLKAEGGQREAVLRLKSDLLDLHTDEGEHECLQGSVGAAPWEASLGGY